jgi:MinD-like ATPase involved in chromosome partitioning or flagellar assembly
VDLLLGSLKEWRMRQPHLLKQKLEPAREWYDYIILDASPNLNNEVFATMLASDELLLVTTADYPTLSCTMHAAKVAKRRNTPVLGIVLNRSRDQKFELATSEIEDATGVPVIATLPDDIRVLEALAHTQPAAVYAPRRDVSIAYRQLAAQLAGEEYEDPRLLSRIRNFFSTLTRSKGEKKPRHAS